MVRFLRNAVVAKVASPESPLLQMSSDERARVGRVSDLFSEEDLARFLQIMLRTHSELGYKQEQRFHLELGLLKLVHAARLLPLEQLLSGADLSSGSGRPAGGGTTATSSAQRSASSSFGSAPRPAAPRISPFESDTSRKTTPRGESSAEPLMHSAASGGAESRTENAPVPEAPVRGDYGGFAASRVEVTSRPESIGTAAAAVAPAPAPIPAPARIAVAEVTAQADRASECAASQSSPRAESVDALREHVLNALENADQKTIPAMLEAGDWKVQGNEVLIQVSASPTVVELTINNDAQRMLNQFASAGAGRAMKVKVIGGAALVAAKPQARMSSGNATSARARAAQDPVVQRMLDKFGGEIRTVMDQRKG
jgi:DNA polymerase-3 subunit gamma/tau